MTLTINIFFCLLITLSYLQIIFRQAFGFFLLTVMSVFWVINVFNHAIKLSPAPVIIAMIIFGVIGYVITRSESNE